MVTAERDDASKEKEKETKKTDDGSVDGAKDASKNGKAKLEAELSEEDAALKENLELMVMRASDPKAGVAKLALETMRREIRTATRCEHDPRKRRTPRREDDLVTQSDANETDRC